MNVLTKRGARLAAALLVGMAGLGSQRLSAQTDARDDASPFGLASSSEWSGAYPRFMPLMDQAGAGWLRFWTEWNTMQPKQGQWNWKWGDDFLATARANHLRVAGVLAYFAPWASSAPDGTKDYGAATRTFPVRDPQYWKDYVAGMVQRYHQDVKDWEVWNEVNSPTFNRDGTIEDYVDMVRWSYDTAKKIDPQTRIGIGVANFAVAYLNQAIKAGAADHFDYLCVHPYENVDSLAIPDGEVSFLSMADSLRRMLAANKQRADIPLWMTEIGWQAPVKPDALKDATQAQLLVKTYVLGIAQGFQRIFWFEARGPAYGHGTDHGIIREDWTLRPSYTSLQAMVRTLSREPQYVGWLNLDGGYGFVFQTPKGKVLVAWAAVGQEKKLTFDGNVRVVDLAGQESALPAGQTLTLTNTPLFIADLPAPLAERALAHRNQPFPWGGDYSHAQQVTCQMSQTIEQKGIQFIDPKDTQVVTRDGESCRQLDSQKTHEIHFRINPTFAPFGTTRLAIKLIARRAKADQPASVNLRFESLAGRHGYSQAGRWDIPADDRWHEHVWTTTDANFVGTWGYNIAICEPAGVLQIKELSVQKTAAGQQ